MKINILYTTNLSEILSEGKYILPLRFFKKRNKNSVLDITSELIIEFCESEGAGVKKVSDFIQLLIDIYISKIDNNDLKYNIREIDFWFAQKEFKRIREYAKDIDIKYVEEIDENILSIIPMVNGMNKKKVEKIKTRLAEYNKIKEKFKVGEVKIEIGLAQSPQRILFSLANVHSKERVKEVIHRRYAKGETLENIGEAFGVSRERVRQVQVIGMDEIRDYLNARKFKESLKNYFDGAKYCTYKEFSNLFNKENKHYASLILHSYDKLYLFKELELVYFEDNTEVLKLIKEIVNRLPKEFFLYDYLDYLMMAFNEIGLININKNSVKQLLTINGYFLYGEYITSNKLTSIEVLGLLFRHFQIEPLKFNEDGFERVKKLSKKHLEYTLEGNIRAFENRLRENTDILLVDKLTFQHIKNASIDEDVVMKIGEMLEEHFLKANIVNASQIFNCNKGYLIKNRVTTKYKMYNLISIYFGDYYKVGRGNTLDIYKSENVTVQNKEEILIEFIKKYGGIVSKDTILNDLAWPSYKMEDTISKSKDLLKLGEDITTITHLALTEDEVNCISNIVNNLLLNGGYTTGLLIFEEVKREENLMDLVKRVNINRSDKISSIVKKLFNHIRGHINFIYNESSPYRNIEEAISGGIQGRVQRDKLKEYMASLGYRDMMTSMTINRVIENGSFYELSREELVSSRSFELSDNVIKSVIKFIEKRLANEKYLVISNITDYSELEEIEYEWTPHLIKSIACRNGYKSIERIYNDIRGEKIIIGREDGEIQSYDELLLYLLRNSYKGVMLEGKIYDFFAEIGVVKRHKDLIDKKIPHDLKITGKIKIDEVGVVTLIA